MARKNGAFQAIIPDRLIKKLQPLDLSPNHSFKNHMWQQWETWMVNRLYTYTKNGNLKKKYLMQKYRIGYQQPGMLLSWARFSKQERFHELDLQRLK